MSTQTAALPDGTKLTKPASGEKVSLSVINTNTDNIANNIIGLNRQMIRLNPYEPGWTSNADLNTYTQTGTYYLSTGRQNGVGGDWGMLQVIGGRADTFNQIYRANGRIFEREYRATNGWTAWKELVDLSQIHGLSETKNLTAVADLNSCMYAGAYAFNLSTSNTPASYGVCFVIATNAPDNTGMGWVAQFAFTTSRDWKLYMRTNINNSGWTAWKSITFA